MFPLASLTTETKDKKNKTENAFQIQHCERSELRLHFEWTKLIKNAKNGPFWRVFENLKLAVKQCYQAGQL